MKRHPIRGVIGGFLVGLGVSIFLVIYSAASFETIGPPIVVTVCISLIGLLLGLFGPARGRRRARGDDAARADA